jgi:hypothetical protein
MSEEPISIPLWATGFAARISQVIQSQHGPLGLYARSTLDLVPIQGKLDIMATIAE